MDVKFCSELLKLKSEVTILILPTSTPIQNELLRTRSLGFQARTINYCFGKVVIMFTLDPMRNHARLTDNSRAMSAQRAPTKFSTGSLFDQISTRMRLECFEACRPPKHHQTRSLGVLGDACYGFFRWGHSTNLLSSQSDDFA